MSSAIDRLDEKILRKLDGLRVLSESGHAADGKALIRLHNVENVNQLASGLSSEIGNTLYR